MQKKYMLSTESLSLNAIKAFCMPMVDVFAWADDRSTTRFELHLDTNNNIILDLDHMHQLLDHLNKFSMPQSILMECIFDAECPTLVGIL